MLASTPSRKSSKPAGLAATGPDRRALERIIEYAIDEAAAQQRPLTVEFLTLARESLSDREESARRTRTEPRESHAR